MKAVPLAYDCRAARRSLTSTIRMRGLLSGSSVTASANPEANLGEWGGT